MRGREAGGEAGAGCGGNETGKMIVIVCGGCIGVYSANTEGAVACSKVQCQADFCTCCGTRVLYESWPSNSTKIFIVTLCTIPVTHIICIYIYICCICYIYVGVFHWGSYEN